MSGFHIPESRITRVACFLPKVKMYLLFIYLFIEHLVRTEFSQQYILQQLHLTSLQLPWSHVAISLWFTRHCTKPYQTKCTNLHFIAAGTYLGFYVISTYWECHYTLYCSDTILLTTMATDPIKPQKN